MKAEALRASEKKKRRADELVNALNGLKLEFKVKSGEEGRLYGTITSRHIADQIEKTAGLKLDHRKIVLEEPLKTLGSYEVQVASGAGTHATLVVEITEE
ncbi:MAG: 50S ribosomal protein L9, partial [bacterium]